MAWIISLLVRGWKFLVALFGSKPAASPAPPAQPKRTEDTVFNPLELLVGYPVRLEGIDFTGVQFRVTKLSQFESSISGEQWCDYSLIGSKDGMDQAIRLRAYKKYGKLYLIALHLHEEAEADSGIAGALEDPEGKFIIETDGVQSHYSRLDGRRKAIMGTVTDIADTDGSGKVETDEVTKRYVSVWDYSRKTQLDGVDIVQYAFVEHENNSTYRVEFGYALRREAVLTD